ncbi:sugar phosphate isomerase/epimerase family protein [Lacticaseibacillus parakribbianus]|uniref:sugar phosphate isomerase/epimerase family protein n=1 Tax=Lacticaseibacillus parakribbianus TaxID=2970927 RepID=UPI0021CB26A9|nr:sugar phosphate isomerase/epimerase [Lacticaseibacillus parakribbianus]
MKSGLQLYSIGAAMQQAPITTIEQVAKMGYQGVEFAGYFDQPAEALRATVKDAGMQIAGSHLNYEQLVEHLEAVIAYERPLGNRRLIVPWAAFDTIEAWDHAFALLEEAGQKAHGLGYELIYHNHGHEFMTFPGVDLLDRMYQATTHVKFEVDVYWLAYAGIDVMAWLEAHQDRVAMLHMKDLKTLDGERQSVELGTGDLPLRQYTEFAKAHGIEWLVVEQEAFAQDEPLVAAAKNATYLNNLIKEVER